MPVQNLAMGWASEKVWWGLTPLTSNCKVDGKAGAVPHWGLNRQLHWVAVTLGGSEGWDCSVSNSAVKSKYMSTLKIKLPLNKARAWNYPAPFLDLQQALHFVGRESTDWEVSGGRENELVTLVPPSTAFLEAYLLFLTQDNAFFSCMQSFTSQNCWDGAPSLSIIAFCKPDTLSAYPLTDPDYAFVWVEESSQNTGNQIPDLQMVYQCSNQKKQHLLCIRWRSGLCSLKHEWACPKEAQANWCQLLRSEQIWGVFLFERFLGWSSFASVR